ncbi:hypothetical protein [Bacillus cereus]|uniref:Uncharacterized protein n=1 Tax=Bacillus cereus TaxID=1396 RepID=A0A164QF32_BACCE|nr:hypothetical protein [Bacillus cereus]KZD71226.1 hypothetical protein B4088_0956 [Bacillus cereus]HDR8321304.1 hypothetical protein [Bacillus cereus]HDR8330248.1 hypothetical protein [Bacillus cereus]HDR8334299.1 hypothetical protein [Bacillus cereus]
MYYNQYKLIYLVENLAEYKETIARLENEEQQESAYYKKLNDSTPARNFVVEAQEEIMKDMRNGVDIAEKYGTKFKENFPDPKPAFVSKEEESND